MKTVITHIYEKGDKVRVAGKQKYGLCCSNDVGGTDSYDGSVEVTITKTWVDPEIGRRCRGKSATGREFFFGEFGADVDLVLVKNKTRRLK